MNSSYRGSNATAPAFWIPSCALSAITATGPGEPNRTHPAADIERRSDLAILADREILKRTLTGQPPRCLEIRGRRGRASATRGRITGVQLAVMKVEAVDTDSGTPRKLAPVQATRLPDGHIVAAEAPRGRRRGQARRGRGGRVDDPAWPGALAGEPAPVLDYAALADRALRDAAGLLAAGADAR
jgi:hypothetical protein